MGKFRLSQGIMSILEFFQREQEAEIEGRNEETADLPSTSLSADCLP